jgi:hypothetical protein
MRSVLREPAAIVPVDRPEQINEGNRRDLGTVREGQIYEVWSTSMHCLPQGVALCLLARRVSQQQFDQAVKARRKRGLQRRLPECARDLK